MRNIFRNDLPPSCSYCAHGATMNEALVSCTKKGVVASDSACRKYTYDPLRRKPAKPAIIRGTFTDADFALEDAPLTPTMEG